MNFAKSNTFNSNPVSIWLAMGTLLAAISVGMGAFGAHGLPSAIEGHVENVEKNLATWETASRYLMYHALGLVIVGMLASVVGPARWLNVVGVLFVVGIVLFSGLLYVLALTDIKILGAIVPLGGLAMIIGWLTLATGLFSRRIRKVPSTDV